MLKEIKRELITEIESGELVVASTAAVAVMKMYQITCGFLIDDDKTVHPLFKKPQENPRMAALLDLVDSMGDLKITIWAKHIADIETILEMLGDKAVGYYGATKDKDREIAVKEFTDPNSKIQYFVSNPASGGTGLNLQACCNRAIYYSNSDNSIQRWQSEDRIHRIGGSGSVIYTDLIAKGGIDRKILNRLAAKKAISEMAIGEFMDWLQSDDEEIDTSLPQGIGDLNSAIF
jgi:SNF2 family DNA or RNA helicase